MQDLPELTDEQLEIQLFLEAIYRKYGYDFRQYSLAHTRRRLEYRRAIEDFEEALSLKPGMAIALADRGAAHEKLGDYDSAIRDLDQAIALDPSLAIAYYSRGLAYGSKGDEVFVVVLSLEKEQWGLEDLNSPSKASFQQHSLTMPPP